MEVKDEVWMDYRTDKKTIELWCSDVGNASVAALLNLFLRDLSKGKQVFLRVHGLPNEDPAKTFDTGAILEKAQSLVDPLDVFFNVSGAGMDISRLDHACGTFVYYFDDKVKWADFLASSDAHRLKELVKDAKKYIKRGMLSAYFASMDQGADFRMECSKDCEENVLALLRELSGSGCIVRRVRRLPQLWRPGRS